MGDPRKRKVDSPMKGMVSPWSVSEGSYPFPVEAWKARLAHLGILAFSPAHWSHCCVFSRSAWQDAGPSPMRQVSSAYWRWLQVCKDLVKVYPMFLCSDRVSTKVFMTVLKIDTDKGSPWKTPMPRWKGEDVHCLVRTIPVRPVYRLEMMSVKWAGAW